MRSALVIVLSLLGWIVACGPSSTKFLGAPTFPNGVSGCRARCSADGLEMSGFIYSGEFATSCVCRPLAAARGAVAPGAEASSDEASARIDAADEPGEGERAPTAGSEAMLDSRGPSTGPVESLPGDEELDAAAQAGAATAVRARSQQPILQHRKP